MSTTLDPTPRSVHVPTWERDVAARPRAAPSAALRWLRAIRDAWRFALICMRLSKASDEASAAPGEAGAVLDRASAESAKP